MQILRTFLLITLAVAFAPAAFSQAEQLVKEADNAFENEAYYGAIDAYKKAYAKENGADEKARMLYQIAESYRLTLDLEQQIIWYNKAIKAQYDKPKAYLYLAQAYHKTGDFKQAIEYYNKYNDKNPGDPLAGMGIQEAEMAKEMRDNPTRYIVQNEILLNSAEYDFSPA